jgi:hypothetical protein
MIAAQVRPDAARDNGLDDPASEGPEVSASVWAVTNEPLTAPA